MMNYGYQLRRVSGPDLEPVTLAQAKRQCKVDDDITEDDALITDLIGVARELAEEYIKGTLMESTWELIGSDFPAGLWTPAALEIPMGPVIEVLSLTYLDPAGVRQGVDLSTLQQLLAAQPPYIMPVLGAYWPSARYQENSIVLTYRAGYLGLGSPPDAANVPRRAKQAILLMVAHWYEHRAEVVSETRQLPTQIPYGFERLLDSLRRYP